MCTAPASAPRGDERMKGVPGEQTDEQTADDGSGRDGVQPAAAAAA